MRGTIVAAVCAMLPWILCDALEAGVSTQAPAPASVPDVDPPPPAVPIAILRPGVDSVFAAPGESYPATPLHRFLFGNLHRDLWHIPFKVAVLDLDSVGGGLTVQELSGGNQTLGLRFAGRDGLVYQFRSIVKNARRAMPEVLGSTVAGDMAQDQMAAQFPLGAMIVAELLEAVDVLVARPTPVIMPDDARLGEYREAFAGRMGWIEIRPNEREGDRPGFAGSSKITGTEALYEELRENPLSYVDAHALLRARLIDILVGDWDRHEDQWRWARFEDGDRMRWTPIPRDRDWAFSRIDGVMPDLAAILYPMYVGFSSDYPDIGRLAWLSQRIDRTLLASLDRHTFMGIARAVQVRLTDEVLRAAVRQLPPPYRVAGDTLLHALRSRRDDLTRAASEYYALLAREASIHATDHADSAIITTDGRDVRIRLHGSGPEGRLRYDRTFRPDETDEVRIYLLSGDDRVVIRGPDALPFPVRVATGEGDDRVTDFTSGEGLYVYDSAGNDDVALGSEAFFTNNDNLIQDSVRTAKMLWKPRDWGSAWVPLPTVRTDPELGWLVGVRLSRYGYGFGRHRCRSCLSLEVRRAIGAGEWIAEFEMDRLIAPSGWWLSGSVTAYTGRPTWFYGYGNDLPPAAREDHFMGFRHTVDVRPAVRYAPDTTWHASAGLTFRRSGRVREGGVIFDSIGYGTGQLRQLGVTSTFAIDTRDDDVVPSRGVHAKLHAEFQPAWLDIEQPYGTLRANVRSYHSASLPGEPALHLRLVGEKVWGAAPYSDSPVLGGSLTLPGFARQQFRGNAIAAGAALLRARVFSADVGTDLDVGVHGLTGIGRVWYPGEERSATLHRTVGAGTWVYVPSLHRAVAITFVRGSHLRTYVEIGFMF